jgi:hypothetical protein
METYLMGTAMKHPNVLVRYNVHSTALNVSELDEVGFECQDPGVAERKANGRSLPVDTPLRSCPPSITIDEEGELRVVQEELAVETLNMDWLDVLFTRNEIERSISLIEQRLCLEGLKRHDFKAASTGNAELRLEEMDGRGFSRDIELFERLELVLTTSHELAETFLLLALGHSIVRLENLDSCRQGR